MAEKSDHPVVGDDRQAVVELDLVKVHEGEGAHDLWLVHVYGFPVAVTAFTEENVSDLVEPAAHALVVDGAAGRVSKNDERVQALISVRVVFDVLCAAIV